MHGAARSAQPADPRHASLAPIRLPQRDAADQYLVDADVQVIAARESVHTTRDPGNFTGRDTGWVEIRPKVERFTC